MCEHTIVGIKVYNGIVSYDKYTKTNPAMEEAIERENLHNVTSAAWSLISTL